MSISRSGDEFENEFSQILKEHEHALHILAFRVTKCEQTSKDIVQDVFCDAWRVSQRAVAPCDGHEGAEEGIRRWLFNAAYWRAISALRRRRLIRWESLDAITEQHGEIPLLMYPFEDAVLEGAVLRDVFATLAPEAVALLLLNIVHGFTTAEIAEITGISTEAAKKRLTRAKQRLRAGYLARNPRSQETQGS